MAHGPLLRRVVRLMLASALAKIDLDPTIETDLSWATLFVYCLLTASSPSGRAELYGLLSAALKAEAEAIADAAAADADARSAAAGEPPGGAHAHGDAAGQQGSAQQQNRASLSSSSRRLHYAPSAAGGAGGSPDLAALLAAMAGKPSVHVVRRGWACNCLEVLAPPSCCSCCSCFFFRSLF